MNQRISSKNTLGRANHHIHALSIILASLIIQICCSLIPFGPWAGKAEGLAGDPWKAQYPPVEAGFLNDIWAVSADNIFAVGYNIHGAFIGHYDGQVWKYMEASILGEPFAELKGIWGSSENDIYAVGGMNNTETLILHYNGFEWSLVNHNFSGYLFDIWGSGPDDVFSVGVEGLIIHWDGGSWNEMDSNTTYYLEGVWGDGQNKVYAVGEDSILLYENNSWNTLSDIPACFYLTDIWGVPGGDVFAVGDCILQYHEGQWSDVTPYNEFNDFQLYKIVGKSENEIMTVGAVGSNRVGYRLFGEEGLIIRYEGQTWQIEDNPAGGPFPADLTGAWIGDQGKAVVVGGNVVYYDSYGYYDPTFKGIFLSFDGASWTVEPSEEYYNGALYQIWARSSRDIFAVGGYPYYLYDWFDFYYLPAQKLAKSFIAHYDGHKWSRVEVEEEGVLYDIWGSNGEPGELFAVGEEISLDEDFGWDFIGGQILHSSDGIHWQSMDNDFNGVFYGVWGSSPQNVFAIGNSLDEFCGTIYRFNGNTWEQMGGPFYYMELLDIWGYDANNIFIAAWSNGEEKGVILYYNGATWTIMNHNINDDFSRVWGTSPNDVFVAGGHGIYHYNGQTWSQSFIGGYFDDVWGTSSTDVFATGDDGILHYNGTEWEDTGFLSVSGGLLFGIGGTSSDDVYIVGDYGRIYHYEKEQSGLQKVLLRKGWNLISFQINVCLHEQQTPPEAPLPEGVEFRQVGDLLSWLSDGVNSPIRDAQNPAAAGDWQRITSFDLNGAHMVDKDMPSYVNDLNYLAAGYGYWIKMNAPGYLLLEGSLLPPSVSLPLRKGWNLIGSLSPDICYYDDTVLYDGEDKPSCIVSEVPSVTFEPVAGGLVQRVFNSIDGKYRRVTAFYCDGAKMYDTQVPAYVCDLYYQAPGCGYWIKMTAEGTLTSP